jgi:hypothetical protein
VAHYGQAVITLYLAAQDLGGAGEVMAALNAAQGCAEAAVDRYGSDCEFLTIRTRRNDWLRPAGFDRLAKGDCVICLVGDHILALVGPTSPAGVG